LREIIDELETIVNYAVEFGVDLEVDNISSISWTARDVFSIADIFGVTIRHAQSNPRH
jgi:hypothetical protein